MQDHKNFSFTEIKKDLRTVVALNIIFFGAIIVLYYFDKQQGFLSDYLNKLI